jgi:hypothetical protein
MKELKILVILVFSIGLFACASAPLKDQFSVPHPVEMEKRNVTNFIAFGFPMPRVLLIEKPAGAVAQWELRGDSAGREIKGTAYFSGRDPLLGNEMLTAQVENISLAELASALFVLLDQSRTRCLSLVSGQWEFFDEKKFSGDPAYRRNILARKGSNLAAIRSAWEAYCKKYWLPMDLIAKPQEVKVGSAEWQAYKREMENSMTELYKLRSGEIRMGTTPLAEFKREATENPGLTWWQRFRKNFVINIPLVPLPPVLLIGLAESTMGAAIGATAFRDPSGYYWDTPIKRGDMAGEFVEFKSADEAISTEHWKMRLYLQYVLGTLLENGMVKKSDLDRVSREVAEYLRNHFHQ